MLTIISIIIHIVVVVVVVIIIIIICLLFRRRRRRRRRRRHHHHQSHHRYHICFWIIIIVIIITIICFLLLSKSRGPMEPRSSTLWNTSVPATALSQPSTCSRRSTWTATRNIHSTPISRFALSPPASRHAPNLASPSLVLALPRLA